ncbi:MAG TPA: 2-phospho-L-lactate guanylyltransferase [Micromonosporaceae bacterium]
MHVASWTVIIPIKAPAVGKSRLRGAPADDRVVLAIALDTVAAALASDAVARVLVVTSDEAVADAVSTLGASTVRDPAGGGLNRSIAAGAAHAGHAVARAALLADLPALRGEELTAALGAIHGTAGRAYVPDHTGTGTTLLGALPGINLDPRFGPGSADAHASSGAIRLRGDWPGLRLDVDTAADLIAARELGLGGHTSAALGEPGRGRAPGAMRVVG